jgi:gluconolactonase
MRSVSRLTWLAVVLAAVLLPCTALAQARSGAYTPPRTPWGDPDLQGAYTNSNESLIPMERPQQLEGKALADITPGELATLNEALNQQRIEADKQRWELRSPLHWFENHNPKNSRAWLVTEPADGRVPAQTAEARQRAAARAAARKGRGEYDSYEDRSLYDRCISRGIPGSMMPAIYGNSYDITQGPGVVAIRYEMINETRVIPLGRRDHLSPAIRTYMGDARGWFEGHTLVVETTNFTDKLGYRGSSDRLTLVERFTPTGPDTVEWSVTLNDPATWARPWAFAMALTKTDEPPFEYACHEGNYAMFNMLSTARAEEAAAQARPSQQPGGVTNPPLAPRATPPAPGPQGAAPAAQPLVARVVKLDPALDAIVDENAAIEKAAGGVGFAEGPVWLRDGALAFSDIPGNTVYRIGAGGALAVVRKPSGYDGEPWRPGAHIGSNGLTIDGDGRIVFAEHGNRRVTRMERDGTITVLASQWEGKRLNSPNDVIFKKDGTLYFTDPPYGLPQQDKDPGKEIEFSGIYRLKDGKVELLARELARPNGIAFSPDEKFLYVANAEQTRRIWMRYEVKGDGTLGAGTVFFDATGESLPGIPDGLKVDVGGNLVATGPGGVWILTPQGKALGRIEVPELPANVAFGDDGNTLYMTARTSVYKIRLKRGGVLP